jgi:hypothetical protein
VNTIAWTTNPKKVGHPLLFAIGPTKGDKRECTNLNAMGLNNNNKIKVVWRVYFHFKEELSAILEMF